MIQILNSSFVLQAIIPFIIKDNLIEEINGIYEYEFSTVIDEKISTYITDGNIIKVQDDYFDITYYEFDGNSDGTITCVVKCEHISYRLNNYTLNDGDFTVYGTLTSILTNLLSGTGFTVGTITDSTNYTYSLAETKTKKAILYDLLVLSNQEIYYSTTTINIIATRGDQGGKIFTKGRNISVIKKTFDKKTNDGNPLISYICEPINLPLETIELGDLCKIYFTDLNISQDMRIVSIQNSVYNNMDWKIELSNQPQKLTDSFYKIATENVKKDSRYFGVKIGPETGISIESSDLKSRAIFNSDYLKMQVGDGLGGYTDKLYFDTILGKLVINGKIDASEIVGGTITGTDINNGSGTFHVDDDGVLTATEANITGSITGSSFDTRQVGDTKYISIDDDGFIPYKLFSSVFVKHGIVQETANWDAIQFFHNGDNYGGISSGVPSLQFYAKDSNGDRKDILHAYDAVTYPDLYWDFSGALNVLGLSTDSQGSHTHTVVVDSVTYTTSSNGNHSHSVNN